ncbi:MAG: hypothetical protein JO056_04110 [Alphaproteobacteria bacterium]|nr:hypothetical protein [Alphaproteobacteria bacterium]
MELDDNEEEDDEEDDDEDESEDSSGESSEELREPSPTSRVIGELRQRIEAQKARIAEPPAVPQRIASQSAKPAVALLRGVAFDPAVPSRMNKYDSGVPQLELAPLPDQLPPDGAQTEALLNAIIGECHFMMREVAFRSMCQADVLEDRRIWANTAMDFARTGAKVANSVAGLRHGVGVKETRHTTIIQNQVAAQVVGGGGPSAR